MKNGYDGAGIPISRSGPWSPVAGSSPGEVYNARGVGISRTAGKDGGSAGNNEGKCKSPSLEPFAKGTW